MAPRSVHLFWHSSPHRLSMLFNGLDNSKKLPLSLGDLDPIQYMVPWAHMNQPPNGISTSSAIFAGLMNVTDRHIDTHTHTH